MEHLCESQSHLLGRSSAGPRARGRAVACLAAAVLLLALPGCIFSPRSPDGPPDEGSEIPWVTPTTTDKVLQNLAAALTGEGISNYTNCFTDDYRFHVDPQDSLNAGQEGEDRYANWTIDDEGTYVGSVFQEADAGIEVTFSTVIEPDESQDETYRREDYALSIVWRSGDHQPGEMVVYRGQATFWLRRDDTELWSIFEWVDRRADNPGGSVTWGVLRGDYRG